jgi:anaerobic ribonucleoside-triphosphate reductase
LDENNSTITVKIREEETYSILYLCVIYNDHTDVFGYNPPKFYCRSCGKEHRKRICPKCGSMAVRVG